jgi:alpha-amylase
MVAVCFYFQVHQPIRLRKDYTFFNIGQDHCHEDEAANMARLKKFSDDCCLPANKMMLDLIKEFGKELRLSYSISGTTLEQFQRYRPDVLNSFKRLADTGCVEFVGGTYHHSLAFLFSKSEFQEQVIQHRALIKSIFGQPPSTFVNTELIYSNDLARVIEHMGYAGVLTEGADHVIGWRTPNFVYRPVTCTKLKVLARHYRLSEEMVSRALDASLDTISLSAGEFAGKAHAIAGHGEILNLFMDYSFLAQRQGSCSLDFFRALPRELLKHQEFCFRTPTEIFAMFGAVAGLDVPHYVSWSDSGWNTSSWVGNSLQSAATEYLFKLGKKVLQSGDKQLVERWRRLQASDHFYCMCTKTGGQNRSSDRLANPYDSPYLAHIVYMNILNDLHEQIKQVSSSVPRKRKR